MRLTISPSWKFTTDSDEEIDQILFKLLHYLHSDPKLTKAAEHANISYRHAWNVLNKWNDILGIALVTQVKGQGTTLTPLGEKLIWAESLIDAQLAPGISTLTSTINRELNEYLGRNNNLIRIHASHGYAIDVIPKLPQHQDEISIDLRYMGSAEAIESLANNDCDLAGFHICTHPLLRNHISGQHYKRLMTPEYTIIKMVIRKQGFIVQKNNPKFIHYIADLIRPDVQIINRQKTAGTRILLDELIHKCGINNRNINGYHNEEYTHTAVAAHVASGAADIGFGIEYAARKFNLHFIPIVSEQYVLACKSEEITSPTISMLLENINSHEFAKEICNLPGYELDSVGTILDAETFLN